MTSIGLPFIPRAGLFIKGILNGIGAIIDIAVIIYISVSPVCPYEPIDILILSMVPLFFLLSGTWSLIWGILQEKTYRKRRELREKNTENNLSVSPAILPMIAPNNQLEGALLSLSFKF